MSLHASDADCVGTQRRRTISPISHRKGSKNLNNAKTNVLTKCPFFCFFINSLRVMAAAVCVLQAIGYILEGTVAQYLNELPPRNSLSSEVEGTCA